ncbi:MAG TPA: bifunctional serine/threonine-protein kinase/formylglycine-generating enzyme family protein [Isosphaeraceae bacterium]|nr:bifunctional serine/threonine-protein kinase/formylglycine-generating enzyme family protein [Isosphaeraceae bacterium]
MDVLPSENTESIEADALSRVLTACERFESEWREGRNPRIETYLEEVGPELREKLLHELLAIEVELRRARGEEPSREEYLQRSPDWAPAIEIVFARDRDAWSGETGLGWDAPGVVRPPGSTETGLSGVVHPGEPTVIGEPPEESRPRARPGDRLPERFGRYAVTGLLGSGGFGCVYLARDEELGRPVAIKVPHRGIWRSPEQAAPFLAEAQMAAGLGHPGIVRVYDIGRSEENEVFVVFEYVEGRNLSERLRTQRYSPSRMAGLLVLVAEAAHEAHTAGLVHRDLKPSNILIDAQGRPHIADFGLAVRESLQHLRTGEIAGTPAYMAPEQIRGETHRLDARTDVWALGVILYQGLVHRVPFSGRDRAQVFDEVLHREPRRPRQIDSTIPRELERICLKCLSKRMDDRYATAAELAEDLRNWLSAEGSTDTVAPLPGPGMSRPVGATPPPMRIIPKGLRAFDLEDADFFPSLVPGPRDRDGLPESIRAWLRRIEQTDPARTFTVGLLYGPSGSGKSSFVKAGLLPRLGPGVRPIYLEASSQGTETRLLAAIRRECPELPTDCPLDEAAAAIREARPARGGAKVLLVLDQFEQWLHSHPDQTDGDLIRALRQCDGLGLQALLLVRDDFWMAITRFLRVLEVRPVEGVNSAAAELFDRAHARRVLTELGRALGRFPDESGPEGARFLDKAVQDLAEPDGRVIPVRLTLFAEMLKHRAWTPATLRELGGFEGIGVMFLEETFAAATAPPAHRAHQRAAEAVLKALLPDGSSDLKGRLRPAGALREAAGYTDRPAEFDELMAILDHELRLVTPVDPSAANGGGGMDPPTPSGETSYQLTHDYLVPPLRQWLTRRQRQTRRGRAELELAAITALWRDRPERRRLPTLFEWLRILAFTNHRTSAADERRMMRAATWHHLARGTVAALALGGLIAVATNVRDRENADATLARALHEDFRNLPALLPELDAYRTFLRASLERLERDESVPAKDREVAQVLLYRDRPTAERAAALRQRLLTAGPDEVTVIRVALAMHPQTAGLGELRGVMRDESAEPAARLRAACALAVVGLGLPAAEGSVGAALADALLAEDRLLIPRWLELLGPAVRLLVRPLGEVCCNPDRDPTTRSNAAEALAEVLKDGSKDQALEFLHGVLTERVDDPAAEPRKDRLAQRQAAAAITLASLGEPGALWPLLRHQSDPRLRSVLIQRLPAAVGLHRLLLDRLAQPIPDPIERQALLLAWAETHRAGLPSIVETGVVEAARTRYLDDPHPGVHSAAELLLRRWKGPAFLAECDERLRHRPPRGEPLRWEFGPNGHTFAIFPAPLEFRMGAAPHESGHYGDPVRHYRRIDRTLAVSTKEVTVTQFRNYDPGHYQDPRYGDEPDCAANYVSWFAAVRYCNRLSQELGLHPSQWCYPQEVGPGMVLAADALERPGFRLPTEAEWEYFCRAGTETARHYGDSVRLLPRYAWTWLNSDNRAHPPGERLPNEFGIFDALGNVWEWCHDGPAGAYPEASFPPYPSGTKDHPAGDPGRSQTVAIDAHGRVTWRLLRGGAFSYAPETARSAHRDWIGSLERREFLGFRVVRTLPSSPQSSQAAKDPRRRAPDGAEKTVDRPLSR